MELLDKYQIHLNELVEGVNCFNYIIDKKFFEHFEITEVNDVDIVAEINIEKRFNIIILRFKISGNINVSCDRCLENFKLNIDHENEVFVKLSDGSSEEQSENMILIPKTESIFCINRDFFAQSWWFVSTPCIWDFNSINHQLGLLIHFSREK